MDSNIEIYNSVWNNNYLKRIIFKHLSIFNKLNININFLTVEDFQEFKLKEYLYDVTLEFDCDLELLPKNIERVELNFEKNNYEETIVIPSHIKSFGLNIRKANLNSNYFKSISESPAFDRLVIKQEILVVVPPNELLPLDQQNAVSEIAQNLIPSSVTSLVIEEHFGNFELKKNILPGNLKKLLIKGVNKFEEGCLPSSLEFLQFDSCSPLILNQLPISGLRKLNISNYAPLISNLTSDIKFPNSLEELNVVCISFNASLPNSLKSLSLSLSTIEKEMEFPPLLEYLKLSYAHSELKGEVLNRNNIPKSLKSLIITCPSILDDDGESYLPEGLLALKFSGLIKKYSFVSQELKPNHLPSSLTYLDLGSKYNQIIQPNVLPVNLKTLKLGHVYNKAINPLSLPNLELLEISNPNYEYPLNDIISTLPNIKIKCKNFEHYYQQFSTAPETLRSLIIPEEYNPAISTLQLADKSKLEYLKFGHFYYGQFRNSDLPLDNNIKTLEIGLNFHQTINLEFFQQLETLIINTEKPLSDIKTSKDENGNFNFYNLKTIIIEKPNHFIKHLDPQFYQFVKKKEIDKYLIH